MINKIRFVLVLTWNLVVGLAASSNSFNWSDGDPEPVHLTSENMEEVLRSLSIPSIATLKSRGSPFTIIVEGNIGTGKSTLNKAFEDYPFVESLPEPVSRWTNFNGTNFLSLAYSNPRRWGTSYESLALLTMAEEHLKKTGLVKVMERSVHSVVRCFSKRLKVSGDMSSFEYAIIEEWYKLLTNADPTSPSSLDMGADVIIYLQSDPVKLFKRIKERNRTEEANIDLNLLHRLHELHEDWLINRNNGGASTRKVPSDKLIVLNNTDLSLSEATKIYHSLARKIWELIPKELKDLCEKAR